MNDKINNNIRKGTILITVDGVRRQDIFNKNLAPYIHKISNNENVNIIKNLTVGNPYKISLPGYHEILCGSVSEQIITNDIIPNKNKTIFEELKLNPIISTCNYKFKGLYNLKRSKLKILNHNSSKKQKQKNNKTIKCYNRGLPKSYYKNCKDDCDVFNIFCYNWKKKKNLNYKVKCGHLGFLGSDAWAHENNIKNYYKSISYYDGVIKYVWNNLRPENIIMVTDHGRGYNKNICCHYNKIKGSEK